MTNDAIPDDPEPELSHRVDQWQAAFETGDLAVAADCLHEDCVMTVTLPSAATLDRAGFLKLLPDYVIHLWQPVTHTVAIDGDTALALTVAVVRATILGVDRSATFLITDCWRRVAADGVWRLWGRHSTPLPLPAGAAGD